MLTIWVADIFGYSDALQQLANEVTGIHTIIIDPYAGKEMKFNNESIAYQYFNHHVGLTNYAQQLRAKLNTINQPFKLVAFSVGGSALWLNAQWLATTQVEQVICFYPSQIRHHLKQTCSVPINIVLPKSEPHFDIMALKKELFTKHNVIITQSSALHGFMNCLSNNFSTSAYQTSVSWLQEKL